MIEETLKERGSRYGDFSVQSSTSQNIKRAMESSANWRNLSDDQKEALELIAVKISRILNGDPDYADSWHDIEGYARLVAERL